MSPHLRAGIIAAVTALVLDQASKLWLLFVFDIARKGAVKVTPFFDLVLAWNVGISFGWFQNDSFLAQAVLTGIKAVAVVVLAVWMARSRTLLATVALGLIIGGAIGNAIDRYAYGAVVDFALFHIQIGGNTFDWYVFNLADVAIVAGVAALCMTPSWGYPPQKRPDPGRYGPLRAPLAAPWGMLPASAGLCLNRRALCGNLEWELARCAKPKPSGLCRKPR